MKNKVVFVIFIANFFTLCLTNENQVKDGERTLDKDKFEQILESNLMAEEALGEILSNQTTADQFHFRETRESKNETIRCKCGVKQNKPKAQLRDYEIEDFHRIVGGRPAELHEYPWRCALFYQGRGDSYSFFCGCSIIHENWVMTAAHCTDPLKKAKLFIDVGDHDLTKKDETKSRFIPVSQVFQHEKYNRRTLVNDISLLKLASPVKPQDNASPVCLPFPMKNRSFDRNTVSASGWGLRKEGKRERPTVLNTVDLSVISLAQCRRYIRNGITNNMLCTLSAGKDACQGDSGGSLDFQDKETEQHYAIGVVSFGHGCGRRGSPGVFTRVTKYLPFIKEKTGETFCGE